VWVRKLLKPGGLFVQADWEQQMEPLPENHADGFHEEMLRKAYGKAALDVVSIEKESLNGQSNHLRCLKEECSLNLML
jgi:hypothetical protein